ncbi:MAG: fumarylacetoacetate hydrolase family protein [Alphaproteobacteria bacterium]
MTRQDAALIAERLRSAYGGRPIPSLRDAVAPTDEAMAYAIQQANTDHWVAEGRRIAGRKIGLTAKAVQAQLGVDQPDYGVLFADMEIADGGALDPGRVIQPKAEAEVALILARDVDGPTATAEDVLAAADCAMAAIEIVDSRIEDWKITFADTVADNGSSAFYVLSGDRRPLDGLDLYTCGMALEVNGKVASVGAGAACLGHPLNAAAWLARAVGLKAGEVVLTGALGPMVPITPGDRVTARVGGLGAVSFSFGDRMP